MCSDPQTSINRDTGEEMTYACRRCDECIATRRHGWVARAMMEKASSPYSACVTLTYSDQTEIGRQGAAMFAYTDVRDFMSALRAAARRAAASQKWSVVPSVRFLCAGEQGDRNGRCHWHIVIFSNFDLSKIGNFRLGKMVVSERRYLITEGKVKRRLRWSLWPHGFMTLQDPDQAGMNYVLSYCLKDQFTHEKSKGTMREAKAENFATGLFRMSKRPAIGESYFYERLGALGESYSVLPALKLRIPGFHGYYQPSGSFREKMLWALVALNRRALWATGANAPQWSSLLASCSENPNDLEVLLGPQKQDDGDETSIEYELGFRSRETAEAQRLGVLRRRCSGTIPCRECLNGFSGDQLAAIGVERRWREAFDGQEVVDYGPAPGSLPFSERKRPQGVHPLCGRRGTAAIKEAFPRSGA